MNYQQDTSALLSGGHKKAWRLTMKEGNGEHSVRALTKEAQNVELSERAQVRARNHGRVSGERFRNIRKGP